MSLPEEPATRGTQLSPAKQALIEMWKKRQFGGTEKVQRITPRTSDGPPPLSFAQQRLWFLDQLEPGATAYNLPYAVRLRGPLLVDALQRSFDAILRRHAVLRTTVALIDGEPVQVIAAEQRMALRLLDLRGLTADERETEVQRHATEDARRAFDLARGPLIRAALLRAGDDDHVLLLAMHHMVSDGWSMGILIGELVTLYGAYAAGQPATLPPLPIQYADYAVWQRSWLQGPLLEQQLAYWKQRLGGLAVLALPTDRPRPAIRSSRGAKRAAMLPHELSTALAALSQSEGGTLFMAALALFKTLLYRYAGQDDVVIGTPIAGRTRAEVEPLIGFFVNTLVLRTDLAGEPSFRELLRRVREVVLGAYNHQELPFEMLVEELQPKRDLSHNPLFQVMFVLQNAPQPALELPGLTLGPVGASTVTAQFDLTLSVDETPYGLVCVIEYNTDLFDTATIIRMLGHIEVLLAGIVAAPEQSIAALPLLTSAERRQLLVEWQAAPVAVPEQCIHELFAAHAAHTPDAIALVFQPLSSKHGDTETRRPGDQETENETATQSSVLSPQSSQPPTSNPQHLTYGDLAARAGRLAQHLQGMGVGPDVIVGLYVERTPALLVGMLGILMAGGAYLPLDPSYPAERLAFMLEDARVSVVITTTDRSETPIQRDSETKESSISLSPDLRLSISTVNLHADWQIIAQAESTPPAARATVANLAYVIYTSGSTGTPKGAMLSHGNVISLFSAARGLFDFDARDVWTLFHSAAFDFSVWEIWGALAYGGKLAVLPYLVSRSPTALYELLRAERVSVLNQTPSAFRQLMQVDEAAHADDLALRLVIFGGEALDLASLRPWVARHGDQCPRLINMYGITETTVHVTYRALAQADIDASDGSRIGRPLATLRAYLLDRRLQPVPIGVVGELYIAGVGLARGYLNRPDLTAERFVPNPFGEGLEVGGWGLGTGRAGEQETGRPGGRETGSRIGTQSSVLSPQPSPRLYRTGDLARYRPDGDLEYFGRGDQQVKVRGFRIELGEIEAVLAQHPAVRQAVVLAREDAPGDRRLVAYVGPRTEWKGPSETETTPTQNSVLSPQSSLLPALRAFLAERLPSYMTPAVFVLLDALPLTPSGKIDRRALPAPDHSRPALAQVFVPPRTPEERTLADIWAKVLGLEQIGVHDNFFDLGGDSMRSIQVLAQAREHGLSFSLQQLFQYQTISELAQALGPAEPPPAPAPQAQPFSLLSDKDRAKLQSLRERTAHDKEGK